jgi:glycosyltransferase involved in cell wall biosynthesis
MRVLWLCSYPPYPADFGGARRIFNLMEQARRAGHQVYLLGFASGDAGRDAAARAVLADMGVEVELLVDPAAMPAALGGADPAAVARKRRGQLRSLFSTRPYQYYANYSPLMQAALLRAVATFRPDVIQAEASQMGYYQMPPGVPAVIDLHNVEYEILGRAARAGAAPVRRMYNWSEYIKFRRAEPRIWRRFAGLLVTSDRDGALVRQDWPDAPVTVVPNGVDTAFFHPPAPGDLPADGLAPQVVFTGMMAYYPNHDAALYCAEAIWPLVRAARPDATWLIVGAEPPPEVRALATPDSAITVTGRVDDVRPYIWASRTSIVPLRMGGGTRLKIVEALAMGQAVISTTVGCEGIAVTAGRDLLLADTPAAFAAAIVDLLADPARVAALGTAGRRLAEAQYSWAVVARPLLKAWEDVKRVT